MKVTKAKSERQPPVRVSAGSKILAAIEEATEVLRREGLGSERLTVRTYKVPSAPRPYQANDVKRVRELLGASQTVLAQFLGVSVNTIRSWEQGKRLPQPIACRFLEEIEARPGYWRRRLGRCTAAADARIATETPLANRSRCR